MNGNNSKSDKEEALDMESELKKPSLSHGSDDERGVADMGRFKQLIDENPDKEGEV